MMPALTPAQVQLIGLIVAPAIFALCAFFTRASLRRAAAGLVGVVAFGLVQFAWDRVAGRAGWWSYPGYGTGGLLPMPLAVYCLSGLVYAGFGLVGWRAARRYGWQGLLIFLAAWSLWGFIHDTAGSAAFASSRLMVIGAGAVPRLADFLSYTTGMAAVLLAIRALGGAFRADPLARAPGTTANA